MKKLSFLFLGIISLTACATFEQQAFNWRGQNFDSLVVKYGVPTSQYTLQDESVAYSFVKPCQYTQGQEEVVVVVNTDNTIYDISNVSRCPTPPQETHYDYYVATTHKPEPKSKHEPKPAPAPAPAPTSAPTPAPAPTPAIAKNTESTNSIINKFLNGSNKKETAKQEKHKEEKKKIKESGILKSIESTKNTILAKAKTKKEDSANNKKTKTSTLKILKK